MSGTVNISASATGNQKEVRQMRVPIEGKEAAIAYGGSLSYAWNTRSASVNRCKPGSRNTAVPHTLTVAASNAAK